MVVASFDYAAILKPSSEALLGQSQKKPLAIVQMACR